MSNERNYWQRMRRSRMSRRALLRASGRAGVGAAGLALVAVLHLASRPRA